MGFVEFSKGLAARNEDSKKLQEGDPLTVLKYRTIAEMKKIGASLQKFFGGDSHKKDQMKGLEVEREIKPQTPHYSI